MADGAAVAGLKVLVVENVALLRIHLEDMLQGLGHEVVGWAATVPRAIAEAERLRPEIVLMDIELDEHGDGIEAAREISERFHIPSLFMTGGDDEKKRQRALLTGPVGYLLKPLVLPELKLLLDNLARVQVSTSTHAMQRASKVLERPAQPGPCAAQVPETEPTPANSRSEPDTIC